MWLYNGPSDIQDCVVVKTCCSWCRITIHTLYTVSDETNRSERVSDGLEEARETQMWSLGGRGEDGEGERHKAGAGGQGMTRWEDREGSNEGGERVSRRARGRRRGWRLELRRSVCLVSVSSTGEGLETAGGPRCQHRLPCVWRICVYTRERKRKRCGALQGQPEIRHTRMHARSHRSACTAAGWSSVPAEIINSERSYTHTRSHHLQIPSRSSSHTLNMVELSSLHQEREREGKWIWNQWQGEPETNPGYELSCSREQPEIVSSVIVDYNVLVHNVLPHFRTQRAPSSPESLSGRLFHVCVANTSSFYTLSSDSSTSQICCLTAELWCFQFLTSDSFSSVLGLHSALWPSLPLKMLLEVSERVLTGPAAASLLWGTVTEAVSSEMAFVYI